VNRFLAYSQKEIRKAFMLLQLSAIDCKLKTDRVLRHDHISAPGGHALYLPCEMVHLFKPLLVNHTRIEESLTFCIWIRLPDATVEKIQLIMACERRDKIDMPLTAYD
jgi:hypothetical protein